MANQMHDHARVASSRVTSAAVPAAAAVQGAWYCVHPVSGTDILSALMTFVTVPSDIPVNHMPEATWRYVNLFLEITAN
jgi:hypothetical protein